jgi:glyoxylase-like metal-dependent hydrolase (beta-lactamase superfamily II)
MNKKEKKSIIQMDDQTWRILDGFGKGTVYSYLLCGTESAILIDTGLGLTDMKPITDELTALPVSVVNTHGHVDHISCNYQYDTAYLHPADEEVFLQHSAHDYRYYLLAGLLKEARLPAWLLKLPILRTRVEKFCSIPVRDNRRPLSDGQRLELGGRSLEAIATPGHTPGSVCLLDCERRQLFSGDTICAEGVLLQLNHSCSVETFKTSVLGLKSASDKYDLIWPAHHQLPLDHSWMDEYITCADQIIAGTAETVQISSAIGSGLITKFGRIGLVYRPDNILA